MIEQLKIVMTPAEMRAEIFRMRYQDTLIHHVLCAADYGGFSAEDRYTVLAYNALRERASYQSLVIDYNMTRPVQFIIKE